MVAVSMSIAFLMATSRIEYEVHNTHKSQRMTTEPVRIFLRPKERNEEYEYTTRFCVQCILYGSVPACTKFI